MPASLRSESGFAALDANAVSSYRGGVSPVLTAVVTRQSRVGLEMVSPWYGRSAASHHYAIERRSAVSGRHSPAGRAERGMLLITSAGR